MKSLASLYFTHQGKTRGIDPTLTNVLYVHQVNKKDCLSYPAMFLNQFLFLMQEFHGEEVGDYLNDLIGLLCRNYLPQAEQCQTS